MPPSSTPRSQVRRGEVVTLRAVAHAASLRTAESVVTLHRMVVPPARACGDADAGRIQSIFYGRSGISTVTPSSTRRRACRVGITLALLAVALWVAPTRLPSQAAAAELFRGPSIDLARGPLRVSTDGRHLIHADGTPFFWLGDTAWELFHRLDRDETELYLEDRRRKGFTVIQAVALAELDGLDTPNAYGHTPLVEHDPSRPDVRVGRENDYWDHMDFVVDRASAKGMYVGLLPTWGDKFNKKWGIGPEVFTPENARAYARFLGERYRGQPIIWILGGDRNPENAEDLAIVRAMAAGIEDAVGEDVVITYHPQGGSRSWEWFADDEWLDLHAFQSGHGARDGANYRMTAEGYQLTPVKPVLDAEPRYEDHPVDWRPDEMGWFDEFDVRQAAYWSLLSGAAGHTYGNHNIWQMWEPGRQPVSWARTPWRIAIHHPGSWQMGLVRRLFTSRPFDRLLPDQNLLAGDAGVGAGHQRAARASDGSFLFAYTPLGRPVRVRPEALTGDTVDAYWFDPRTGEATPIGTFRREGLQTFDPPGEEGRGRDWILVIDDASRKYPLPGGAVLERPSRSTGRP